ncbi:hypothetical protein SX4_0978 [Vibrio mimicus SX-4]|nr:hypothetical protein SX4_0978 [Vibrio mimicus SX-4]
MRANHQRIQSDKVTHGVYSELSTENVDKAMTIQKPLHQ